MSVILFEELVSVKKPVSICWHLHILYSFKNWKMYRQKKKKFFI